MTALDDRPMLAPPVHVLMGDDRRVVSDARWDAVIRTVGGSPIWFSFVEVNPLTGRPYARSRWEELPYMISVLARRFVLTTGEWDALAAAGRVLQVTGTGAWRVPFAMTLPPGLLAPLAAALAVEPPDVCGDCAGNDLSIDDDVSMTGTRDAVFLCWCAGDPA